MRNLHSDEYKTTTNTTCFEFECLNGKYRHLGYTSVIIGFIEYVSIRIDEIESLQNCIAQNGCGISLKLKTVRQCINA